MYMVAASLLPISIYKNKLYFLFGKENTMEDSAKGWSDFGGKVEKNESVYEGALREGSEEMTGFLGDANDLKKIIKENGGTLKMELNKYHVHFFYLPYDKNMTKYYNNNHKFLWDRMDNNVLNKTRLFEKIEIKWFSENEMMEEISEFREFYQEFVKMFNENKKMLKDFVKSKMKNKNKTMKKK